MHKNITFALNIYKNFLGRGMCPLPRPHSQWEGGPLPNTPFPPHGLRLLVPPDFENVVAPLGISAKKVVRNGEKYYICFVDTLLLYSLQKNCQNRLTVDEVVAKSSTPRFLTHSVYDPPEYALQLGLQVRLRAGLIYIHSFMSREAVNTVRLRIKYAVH